MPAHGSDEERSKVAVGGFHRSHQFPSAKLLSCPHEMKPVIVHQVREVGQARRNRWFLPRWRGNRHGVLVDKDAEPPSQNDGGLGIGREDAQRLQTKRGEVYILPTLEQNPTFGPRPKRVSFEV